MAIFLNGLGHYGNAATTQDMTEWAGIAVGTVHNCYKCVMLALLHLHDMVIHFDPANHADDYEEKELAKAWVESRSCPAWRNGFLCVDGTTFNLFQKPGYHGEGFYDHKSCYSLSNQVCFNLFSIHFNLYFLQIVILPHNLKIVDYTIGVPGSIHDASAFQRNWIARHPEQFLNNGEWIWADSAYPAQTWCVTPFK